MTFDIIFLDPPFATDFGNKAIEYIARENMLNSDGMIIYEHVIDKEVLVPSNMEIIDEKKYGTIKVTYLGCKND